MCRVRHYLYYRCGHLRPTSTVELRRCESRWTGHGFCQDINLEKLDYRPLEDQTYDWCNKCIYGDFLNIKTGTEQAVGSVAEEVMSLSYQHTLYSFVQVLSYLDLNNVFDEEGIELEKAHMDSLRHWHTGQEKRMPVEACSLVLKIFLQQFLEHKDFLRAHPDGDWNHWTGGVFKKQATDIRDFIDAKGDDELEKR
ncbi:hypothetical protein PG994_007188 [Apiospora phragmitis]|uniref:Uncharacterized protein n=1 Tax=Apiospora phragmitis TaxID=2905665 RepID=A0ABR1V2Q4_9PEZI